MDADMSALIFEASQKVIELTLPEIEKYLSTKVANKSLALVLYLENSQNETYAKKVYDEFGNGELDKSAQLKNLCEKLTTKNIDTIFFDKGLGIVYLSKNKAKKIAFLKAVVNAKCEIQEFKDTCSSSTYLENIERNHPERKMRTLMKKLSELDAYLAKLIK